MTLTAQLFLAVQVLQMLWLAGLTAMTYMRKPGVEAGTAIKRFESEMAKAMKETAELVDRRLNEQDRRSTETETHLEHIATREELAKLEGAVKSIDERTLGMAERQNGMLAALDRIQDHLLRRL